MTVVQKYGGTSVGAIEKIQQIARRIRSQREQDPSLKIAIVVSAMSGETNRLVALVNETNPRTSRRVYDMVVAAGEQVSAGLLAAALEGEGISAEPLLGFQAGVLTDASHASARIQSIDVDKIHNAWSQGKIPVLAGFQGMTEDFQITTLGRGGSDTSAVALAAAVGADLCEINTDVAGVFTADPRIVPDARLIEQLDYESALELASLGSKVLYSRCVELGAKHNVSIVVRDTFASEDAKMTKIISMNEAQALESPVVSGVTLDRDVAKVSLSNLDNPSLSMGGLFEAVANKGVNVDIIVHDHSFSNVGFTVKRADVENAVSAIRSFGSSIEIVTTEGLSKVSAVGLGMMSRPGVAGQVFATLAKHDIPILMVSTSEIKISCVIEEQHAARATQELHRAFFS